MEERINAEKGRFFPFSAKCGKREIFPILRLRKMGLYIYFPPPFFLHPALCAVGRAKCHGPTHKPRAILPSCINGNEVIKTNEVIIIDTREKKFSHITEYFQANGVRTYSHSLEVGDYTLALDRSVVVDRKAGLQEVYGNLIQQHDRFRRELERAIFLGMRLVFLIEEPSIMKIEDVAEWRNPRKQIWEKSGRRGKPPISSLTLMKTMQTISERYSIEWEFCSQEDTARRILDILMYGDGLK